MLMPSQRLPVTEIGVVIPSAWLGEAREVQLSMVDGQILVCPLGAAASASEAFAPDDPIWNLGKTPVDLGISDASVNVDKYVYDSPRGNEE